MTKIIYHSNQNDIKEFRHSIEAHRAKVNLLVAPMHINDNIKQQHIPIKLTSTTTVILSTYKSSHIEAPYPTIFYIPGTAFIANELPFTDLICGEIADQSSCQVIALRHRLAPEYPFPKGLNDIYHLLLLLINYPKIFQINLHQMVLMGYSSGGNLAATLGCRNKLFKHKFKRQILISPILDLSRSLTTFRTFENQDKVIKNNFVNWFIDLYTSKTDKLKNKLISPSWNSKNKLKDSPPTDIYFGERDRFRSDAEDYYLKLLTAQVTTFRIMVNQADHSFFWFQLNIAQAIGARIKTALSLNTIPKPISNSNSTIFKLSKAQSIEQLNFDKLKIKKSNIAQKNTYFAVAPIHLAQAIYDRKEISTKCETAEV